MNLRQILVKMQEVEFRKWWVITAAAIAFFASWLVLTPLSGTQAAPPAEAPLSNPQGNPSSVAQTGDLQVVKGHQGDFQIGGTGVYTITVSNVGADPITGTVTVSDSLPSGMTPFSVAGTGWNPCNYQGQLATCVYSNTAGIQPGTDLPPIVLKANVGTTVDAVVTNMVSISNTQDINPANDTYSDPANIASADLGVLMTVSPTAPAEGETITYTLTVFNSGPATADGVLLTDALPSGVSFVSSFPSQGSYNSANGVWTVGTLTRGEAALLSLRATVNANTRGSTITNQTSGLTSDQNDWKSTNNQASASITVKTTRLTGLVIDNSNDDPIVSASLVMTDSLSHVFTTTTTTTGWYTFTSTITNPIQIGSITLTASESGYKPLTAVKTLVANVDNRQDMALDTTDLFVTKSDGLSTVVPGQTLTYTLTITNLGTLAADNVIITDTLPTYLTYISDTLGITHSVPVAGTYVWKLPSHLASLAKVSFKLKVGVSAALPGTSTSLTNQVRVSTSGPEANLSNNTAQDVDTSTGSPSPSITNAVSPTEARTGQSFSFTVKVTNSGTAPMTEVKVTDSFSSYLDISSATTNKGSATTNSSTRTVTANIGTLSGNETATITIVLKVNSLATTTVTLTNSASMTYKFAGSTLTRYSNSVSFRVVGTTTLPGTGGLPPTLRKFNFQPAGLKGGSPQVSGPITLALVSAVLLGLLGAFALGYGIWARAHRPDWTSWSIRMGILFSIVALAFGLAAWGLGKLSSRDAGQALNRQANLPLARIAIPTATLVPDDIIMPVITPEVLETLPDYPIPTPQLTATPGKNEKPADTSAAVRIEIPALGLSTVVKYVPFDGLTWAIAGLHQEVAWMGETSWPGLGSNTALAGHVTLRDGEVGPFYYLGQLVPNDTVRVYTQENMYTYRVREQRVVAETDISVVQPSDRPQLTLITCTGWDANVRFYMQRLVVFADLVDVEPLHFETRGN